MQGLNSVDMTVWGSLIVDVKVKYINAWSHSWAQPYFD